MKIIRVTKEFERAGAYYVRIHAMARKHKIPLDAEIDAKDGENCNYILALDDIYPVATCRWFKIDEKNSRNRAGRRPPGIQGPASWAKSRCRGRKMDARTGNPEIRHFQPCRGRGLLQKAGIRGQRERARAQRHVPVYLYGKNPLNFPFFNNFLLLHIGTFINNSYSQLFVF